eukprot:COSAG01_NODE_2381_length_7792_cov_5.907578_1_plen_107_part_00
MRSSSALINIMMVAGGVASPLGDDAVLHVTQRCRDDPSLHGCRRMAAAVEEDTEELRAVAADQLDAATSYMQSLLLLLPPSLRFVIWKAHSVRAAHPEGHPVLSSE